MSVPSRRAFLRDRAPQSSKRTSRGTWRPTRGGGASIGCPECRATIRLAPSAIDPTGRVDPITTCVADGCLFRRLIVLDGWTGEPFQADDQDPTDEAIAA